MQIGLIGFAKSGKTTVFNAVTGHHAEVSAYSGGKASTNRASVEVPDERLDRLAALFESRKMVRATIDYLDPVGIARDQAGSGQGLGESLINAIATADALVAVIRAFEDDSGIACSPVEDFEVVCLELNLHDLHIVENRLERIASQIQRVAAEQKKALAEEQAVLERCRGALEAGNPIRSLEFDAAEDRLLRSFQLLTRKTLIALANLPEGEDGGALLEKMRGTVEHPELYYFLALNGQTEMEIAQLEPEDRAEFLKDFGIEEPGAGRMIRACYEALGLISFFTVGPKEAHAWTVRRGAGALEAAGTIHSDLERGFIRAQVIGWQALLEAGSMAEAKKTGQLRIEGKDYVVQDGEAIEVMFSV